MGDGQDPSNSSDLEGMTSEEILPIVYEELRRIAGARLLNESRQMTLQATALVHEAWLRLSSGRDVAWENRAHFFGAAAQAMRRILVEKARSKTAAKRTQPKADDGWNGLSEELANDDHILMIHECLIRLEQDDPTLARVVLLKFYAGLGSREIAEMTGSSVRSVERQWMYAKAKLYQMIEADDSAATS